MVVSEEEKQIITNLVKEEFLKIEIKESLPYIKNVKFKSQEIGLLEALANTFRTGAEIYGYYEFGKFLTNMGKNLLKDKENKFI